MTVPLCRWGILGTANIARKNWQAIRDAGNATLIAVASRDAVRSAQFIAECQTQVPFAESPTALGSYEALIAHPEIDAIYIPLPTGIRKDWVLRAAQAGKHVLVEKPVGASTADVMEMVAACAQHDVQFMDGVMFMHSPRLVRLREILDDGHSVGGLRRISMQFSFAGGESFLNGDIRTDGQLEPFGCLGDLGWYCIRMALWAMHYELPVRVTGRIDSLCDRTSPGVPTEFSGELLFASGVSAAFHISFVAENSEWVVFSGTKGFVRVPDFVLPFSGAGTRVDVTKSEFVMNTCQFDMHERRTEETIAEPSNNASGSQESRMFQTFSALVLGGKTDPQWPDITLKTQRVMDACLHSARQGSVPIAVL